MREIHPVLERLARAIADDSRDSYDNYLPWPVAVSHARAAVQALMEPDTDDPAYLSGQYSRRNIDAYLLPLLGDEG